MKLKSAKLYCLRIISNFCFIQFKYFKVFQRVEHLMQTFYDEQQLYKSNLEVQIIFV